MCLLLCKQVVSVHSRDCPCDRMDEVLCKSTRREGCCCEAWAMMQCHDLDFGISHVAWKIALPEGVARNSIEITPNSRNSRVWLQSMCRLTKRGCRNTPLSRPHVAIKWSCYFLLLNKFKHFQTCLLCSNMTVKYGVLLWLPRGLWTSETL